MNQVAILWRASPASTELELRTVDWVRQLMGLPDGWHGHIEDTASTSTLAAMMVAKHVTGRNVIVCSEHAHSAADKAARMLGMELRKQPADDDLRMSLDGLELDDVAAVIATVGTTSFASVDPVRELAQRAHDAGAWLHVDAAYAGLVVDLRGGAVVGGRDRARRLARRQPAQVAARSRRLLAAVDLAAGRLPRHVLARAGVPADERRDGLARRLRARARPAFPLAEAVGGAALLRRRGVARDPARSTSGSPASSRSWVEADPDWELCAPQRFSLVVFRRNGSDEENEQIVERANASGEIFLSHTKLHGRYVLRLAIGNARTTEDDVRQAWDVLNREAQR